MIVQILFRILKYPLPRTMICRRIVFMINRHGCSEYLN